MSDCFQEWRIAVTTPLHETVASAARVEKFCGHFNLPYIARKNRGLRPFLASENLDGVVVANRDPKVYHRSNPENALFFHPGMASQRMLHLRHGQVDRLLELCELRQGDTVLDATMGLGTDSLVFANGVGPTGRVIGLERVDVLYRLLTYAKQTKVPQYPGIGQLLTQIDMYQGNHLDYLRRAPAQSVDVVYFDPMFEEPADSAGIGPLRPFADPSALSVEAFNEACRVCRRLVVVKERPHSELFRTLGLRADIEKRRFAYGVWRKGGPYRE